MADSFYVADASNKKVHHMAYNASTGLVTTVASSSVFANATQFIIRSTAGGLYVSTMTDKRIYKLTSALAVDTTWAAPNGYITIDDGVVGMAVSVEDKLAVAHGLSATSKNISLYDSDGTLLWSVDPYGGGTVVGLAVEFFPSGDVLALTDNAAGNDCLFKLSETDGSTSDTFDNTAANIASNQNFLHFGPSNNFYITYNLTTNYWLEKWDPDDNTGETWVGGGGAALWKSPTNMFEHSSNGEVYTSGPTALDQTSFLKLNATTGLSSGTYKFATTGSSTNYYRCAELTSGKIVYTRDAAIAGPDGTYDIWILDEDMTFVAGLNSGYNIQSVAGIGTVIITSNTPTDLIYNKKLVAFSGDSVHYEATAGSFTEITDTGGTPYEPAADAWDMTTSFQACEAYQKVFVANNTTKSVVDFVNTRCSNSVAISTYPDRGDILYQAGADAASMIVETILPSAKTIIVTTTDGTVETGTAITTALGGGTTIITPTEVTEAPFIYDWESYQTGVGTTLGSMPDAATLVCLYRGRLVLAGNPDYPFQWYMARQANPFDWLYATADAQSPVAGADADAGQMGDIISCLIPYKDDYLIFGCANSIWVMRGDPAAGGSLDEITRSTGIFGPRSYCFDDIGNLYFWGRGGIYMMAAGFQGVQNLTAVVLPNIVADTAANQETHRIVLAFDRIRLQIYVFVTLMSSGVNQTYVYDLRTQGFFPESYPTAAAVFSAHFYESPDPDYQKVYLGCRDSMIRNFDDDKTDDVSLTTDAAIESYATIGPLLISQDADRYGRMKSLAITTGTNTDSLDYQIYAEDTAEEVVDNMQAESSYLHSGTISSGNRIQRLRPRTRGTWLGIRFSNINETESWQFEKAVADIKPAGDI